MNQNAVSTLPVSTARHRTVPARILPDDLRLWLILLVVICLVSLGSFSFTATSSAPKSIQAATGGACTATAQSIHYQSSPQSSSVPSTWWSTWSKTGRNLQDFSNAQACAAAFTLAYQSFTSSNLRTLTAGIPMLSAGALQRFYGQVPHSQPDERLNADWQATIQKEHLQRSAQVQLPEALTVQTYDGKILIWMAVPYTLSTSIDENTFSENATLTVLLVSTTKGTGWQVSDWRDGQGLFNPPDSL